ncbi:EAL domain-containing protein [Parvibaculum sedimenti]|uniref:EAL domain-containing protein n=1 Tax=Parvibaculum sedimenti TaxID=2608632 RepID=A0A6N6VE88_9HYPH|nr:EAL domain-containing response regulator [Parvibaculum sedimenti]KAB7738863.1 EAL domain-containing protein [Parvibaculum sedimenti]
MQIVLIDDEAFALRLLERQLANLGFAEVHSHTRAQDALDMLGDNASKVGIVFCDLQMPEMDGVELVRHLARIEYAGRLILISGENRQILKTVTELARAHRLDVAGALQKPFTQEQIRDALGKRPSEKITAEADATRGYGADELAHAIERGQMIDYYQPKVDIGSGAVVGVEALVRWQHPEDGIVAPARFIEVAEQHDLIDDLTRIMLTCALRRARAWREVGLGLSVAVNVSMDSLCRLDFPDWLVAIAGHEGVPLSTLVLEVTEGKLMKNPLAALDVLTRLRLKHVGLSIDDFGTGYSSLAQLRDVPFTELKIDRSFVHGAAHDSSLQTIVEASLDIARQLEMKTVAEGVEDRADWDFLRDRACDAAQGYFVAKPLPADEIFAWVGNWETRYRDIGRMPT